MQKIICDICGTSYPETAESCPICGCSRDAAAELLGETVSDEALNEEIMEKTDSVTAADVSKKKAIFDFDEVNGDLDEDDDDEDDEDEDDDDSYDDDEEEESPRHNTFVVILLTVLIIALLAAAGFIFFRYFLPNMGEEETVPVTTAQATEAETEATELVIPCEHLTMTNAGVAELNAEGQQFLLHVRTIPEDTTDKIIYTTGDESIATVTEDGKITAVSEGETVVYISCGKSSMECPVIVKYVEETVPPTTEAVEEPAPAATEEEPAETEAEETQAAPSSDVVLKLKKTDIRLGVYYEFQLELDCELKPEDVTWSSEHPHIAKVDEKGNVTAVKEGTTSISAKYGNQEVQCIVRCVWA